MPAHLTEPTAHGFVPVLTAEHGNLERHTIADDNLQHRIVCFLYTRSVPQSEALKVNARGGTVSVRGRLPDRHTKWLCLECCRRVAGVIKLVDNLAVEASLQTDTALDTEEQINDDAIGTLPEKPR